MLRREEELRFSKDVQHRFTLAESSGNSEWMDVAAQVQRQVLQEFQYYNVNDPFQNNVALHELRLVAQSYDINVQIRQNRCRRGTLQVGDPAPNVVVVPTTTVATTVASTPPTTLHLLDHQHKDRPLVVVAGSYS